MDILNNILNNWQSYLGAVSAVLVAAIAVASLIPGDQPEKSLQAVVDFLARFSRKSPLMIAGILTALGGITGIVLWFLKRKSPLQRNWEAIELERRRRQRDIDAWWTKRPPTD